MIHIGGTDFGTAAEIAQALGGDVTQAMVRSRAWGLQRYRVRGHDGRPRAMYSLQAAAIAERDARTSTRGRPRQLDLAAPLAA